MFLKGEGDWYVGSRDRYLKILQVRAVFQIYRQFIRHMGPLYVVCVCLRQTLFYLFLTHFSSPPLRRRIFRFDDAKIKLHSR